ncbi:MAG: amino acid permease [Nanoarchaeota archaeon]|nr:amino acid permease [Nanoarchaeota archaeon]
MKKVTTPLEGHPHKVLPTLKRELGLFHVTAYGVGLILGAGIYVLAGKAAGVAGNAVWLSFLIAAIVAALTGLSYAELSSRFSKDSGEFYYVMKAMGKNIGLLVGNLVIFAGIISTSAVALGFAGYFSSLFSLPDILGIALVATVLFSLVNFMGIKQAAWLNVVFTAIEVGGLLLIIGLGSRFIGSVNYLSFPSLQGVFSASALVFFSFLGFQSIVKLSEETKKPAKTIPKALLLSILITTIIYILIGVSIVSVMDWQALGVSASPLADVAAAVMGSKAFVLLAIIALFSTANTVLIGLISVSRIIYGMGREHSLPRFLGKIHEKTKTPLNSIVVATVLVLLFILMGDISLIANTTNFVVFVIFIFVNLSVILLRFRSAPAKSKSRFSIPLSIGKIPLPAVLGILASLFMICQLDGQVLLLGSALIVVLLLIQWLMGFFRKLR